MTSSYSLVSDNPPHAYLYPVLLLLFCLNFLTPNLSPLYFHHVSYSQTIQRPPPPHTHTVAFSSIQMTLSCLDHLPLCLQLHLNL